MSSSTGQRALRVPQSLLTQALCGTHLGAASTSCPRAAAIPTRRTQFSRLSIRAASTQAKRTPSASEKDIAPAREPNVEPPTANQRLNPPATTRPPPLDVPVRDPNVSLPSYLLSVGKAYLAFYKTGVKNIFVNRSLLASSTAVTPFNLKTSSSTGATTTTITTTTATTFPSRADLILSSRTRHDLSRLPLFGLMFVVCGEFTPLIVVLFPKLTPFTCRIPKQIDALRRASEKRRAASFRNLAAASGNSSASAEASKQQQQQQQQQIPDGLRRLARGHISRSLDLTSRMWDRIGLDSPFAGHLADRAVREIAADDLLIRRDGGVAGLIDDEVVLACEYRGINVRGKQMSELRRLLDRWVRTTTKAGGSGDAAAAATEEAVRNMLLSADVLIGPASS